MNEKEALAEKNPEYLAAMDNESGIYEKAMDEAWAAYAKVIDPIRKAHDEHRKQIRIKYGVEPPRPGGKP